jgi:hypothetical protein
MGRLLAIVEEVLDHLICLSNVNGMNAKSLIMFYKALEGFAPIIWSLEALDFCPCSFVASNKLTRKV